MDTPTRSTTTTNYWACSSCSRLNLLQLNWCSACDAPRPRASPGRGEMPMSPNGNNGTRQQLHSPPSSSTPLQSSGDGTKHNTSVAAAYYHSQRSAATPTTSSNNRNHSSSAYSHHQEHHQQGDTGNYYYYSQQQQSASSVSRTGSPSSHHHGGGSVAASPLRPHSPSRYLAANFLSDLDSKNAAVSRLEQHITHLTSQHSQQRRQLENELENYQKQLRQALQAHQALMNDYQQCASDASTRQTESLMLSAEVTSLREKLVSETRKRQDEIEQHSTELDAKQRLIRSLRDQIQSLTEEAHSWRDNSTARAMDAAATPHALAQLIVSKEQENSELRSKLSDAELARAEALGSIVRMTTELELEKQRVAEMRAKYADDVQGVLRDALRSNETAVGRVTAELSRSKDETESSLKKEIAALEHRVQAQQEEVRQLKKHHDRKITSANDVANQMQETIARLQHQRDEMLAEARFQMEIQSEFAAEKSALRSEISTLRAAINALERRRPGDIGSYGPRPSPVNTSHTSTGGGTRLTAPGSAQLTDQELRQLDDIQRGGNGQGVETAHLIASQREQIIALEHELEARDKRIEALGHQLSSAQVMLAASDDRANTAVAEVAQAKQKLATTEKELLELKEKTSESDFIVAGLEERTQEEMRRLSEEIENLRADLDQAQFGQTNAERHVADARKQNDRLKKDIDTLERELLSERERASELETQLASAAAKTSSPTPSPGSTAPPTHTSTSLHQQQGDRRVGAAAGDEELEAELGRLQDQLKEQTTQWRTKAEALNKQVTDLTNRNAELEEKARTAQRSALEMEATLSAALANIGGSVEE